MRINCSSKFALFILSIGLLITAANRACAADSQVGPNPEQYTQSVQKAVLYLTTKGQANDGSYSGYAGPGVTGLITTALLRSGRTPTDPAIAKSLKYLEGFVQEDGGIYKKGTLYRNYDTCLAILCFSEANRNGQYDKLLERAEHFVKEIQWGTGDEAEVSSESYGGAGYGKHKRPDLSNTNFLVEALKATGNGPEDEAMKRALLFVSRCQNLETAHNTTKFAAKNPDGGFYYTPAAGGTSQAGNTAGGGLRSYGSMTYAGLKSMIYAGVGPEDPRVKAAYGWVSKNYSLEENPGMGNAGLFYYYHTFAKALSAIDNDFVVDSNGKRHDWRRELGHELIKSQAKSGSWVNKNDRWLEGDPNLVTGYALLSLTYCRPRDAKSEKK